MLFVVYKKKVRLIYRNTLFSNPISFLPSPTGDHLSFRQSLGSHQYFVNPLDKSVPANPFI